MRITFDPAKYRRNLRKHQIDLAEVEGVFFDARAVTIEDRDHPEERFVTIGKDGLGRILVVAYCYRGKTELRVISARLAEPHERRIYEEG